MGPSTPLTADQLDVAALAGNGTRSFDVRVCDLPDGGALAVPVAVVSGCAPGPRLMVVGGVHGDEADGIAAAFALVAALSPADFTGCVTIVPIANPMAFAAGQRRSPVDGRDLNRTCPGDPDGTPSERLAAVLSALVRRNADFLFTLHGWYGTGVAHPHVEFDLAEGPTRAASRAACHAAGFELVVAADWPPGVLPKVAVNAGIPAMESEIGGLGDCRPENVAWLLERIRALMTHLGMTDRPAASAATGPCHRHCYVNAPVAGVLHRLATLGARVTAGETVAVIRDLAGNVVATIAAPATGIVVTERRYLSVARGKMW